MTETSLQRTSFSPPDLEAWRAVVERDLKGAPYAKRLLTRTAEGLTLDCLYTPEGPAGEGEPAGAIPTGLGRAPGQPWRVVASASGDPTQINARLREELTRGADSIRLRLGGALQSASDLAQACEGIVLSPHPLVLTGPGEPLALAALAHAFAEQRPDWSAGGVALDPCGAAARGELGAPLGASLARLSPALELLGERALLEVDTSPFHAAGASEAEDLGLALASGLELLRHAGRPAAEARGLLRFALPLPSDLFLGTAKLRALRALWARVEEVLGLTPAPIQIHAESAWRELGGRDPWVNVLRGTATAFSAAVGGADSLAIAPFDACLPGDDRVAQRVARNTHTILREESHLHRVADPGAGSYYLEDLSAGLAREAWAFFQSVEGQGGLAQVLESGWLSERLAARADERAQSVAKRRLALTGVSDYPLLSEAPPPPLRDSKPPSAGEAPGAEAGALQSAAAAGAGIATLGRALGGAAPSALLARRLAEPFEALRAASDAALAETGERPRAFLLGLGALAAHTGRSTWIRNLLAAGGIEGLGAEGAEPSDAVQAFCESEAKLVVLCGRDSDYAERAGHLIPALLGAGAEQVLLAGRPGEREQAYREAGASDFLYLGCDVVAALRRLHGEETQ
jgi:methylmalonyl-CoA mutase